MIKTINLEQTDKHAWQETIEHPDYIKSLTGIDPFAAPLNAMKETVRLLDIDWVVALPRKSVRFDAGESKKKIDEHSYVSQWGFTGSYWHDETGFSDEQSVYDYDPFAKYTSLDHVKQSIKNGLSSVHNDQQELGDNAVVTGLYYTTLFQWFILTFGWEMFLIAAATNEDKFSEVIKRFADLSVEHFKVLSSELPFIFCHDDLALTRGLVFQKEWYNKNIFPHYERMFHEVKQNNKKVMFVSDGNYTEIIDDLFDTGIDGILFDHTVELDKVLKKYGNKKIIAGNMNSQILTFGNTGDVKKEVNRCLDLTKEYAGYILKCSNDLPHNIPSDNIKCYFDTIFQNR